MEKERHKITPASYLFLTKDNKVLLLRRYNTGYEDGKYSMIAGHVDQGESFTQCMVREAQEEAGILIKPENLTVVHIVNKYIDSERIDIFFTTDKWVGEIINKEPQKCDDLSWFDLDNLPENVIPFVKNSIECIKNKILYSEAGYKN
ncbi:MAG: NUDIX domain-containing protein [Candidatus Staskawiczbacteria bacterium]|jgi:8-oxo-dGTP pyrophosphatase MutT (NUDIX family)